MRKLKDFFYDKNDIIIVLIIIAVAAFIIYTRVEAIMEYPEQYAKEIEATASEKEPTPSTTEATESTEESSNENISITIDDDDYSSTVAEKLAEAGLVSSAEEFDSYINESGKSSSIQSGTFQIPSGATFEEILEIIT